MLRILDMFIGKWQISQKDGVFEWDWSCDHKLQVHEILPTVGCQKAYVALSVEGKRGLL